MNDSASPQPERSGPAMRIPWIEDVRSHLHKRLDSAASDAASPNDTSEIEGRVNRMRALEIALDALPYNLSGAFAALRRFDELARAACNGQRPHENKDGVVIYLLSADEWWPLSWTVDAFLDSARRAQNAVMPYISRTYRCSLPQSLSKTNTLFAKAHPKVPDEIRHIVRRYWQEHGQQLKDYRDVAQHYALIASDARVLVAPDGRNALFLLLPDQPTPKRVEDIRFTPPYIPAALYCRGEFVELFRFVYELMFVLLRSVGYSTEMVMSLVLRTPLVGGDTSGFVFPGFGDMDDELWRARAETKRVAEERYGTLAKEPHDFRNDGSTPT